VASIAASWWINWCLRHCSFSAKGTFDQAPVIGLASNSLTLQGGVRGAMTCCCGKGEEDDHEKWKVLRNIQQATSHNGKNDSQLAGSTQDISCCV